MKFYFSVGGTFGRTWIAFGIVDPSGRRDVFDYIEFDVEESSGIAELANLMREEPNCGTLIAAYIISRSLEKSTTKGQDPLGIVREILGKVSAETWGEMGCLLRTNNDCGSFIEQVAPEIVSLFGRYKSIFMGVVDLGDSGRDD